MKDFMSEKEHLLRIEDEAAEWLLQLEETPTEQVQRAFNRWLNEDERHNAIYQQMSQAWELSSTLSERDLLAEGERLPLNQENAYGFPNFSKLVNCMSFKLAVSCCLLVMVLSFIAFSDIESTQPLKSSPIVNLQNNLHYKTSVGEFRQIMLPDNTQVDLSSGSEFIVRYEQNVRNIELIQGEAFFTVAKNKARPFIVSYQGRIAQALGTAFNVKESQGNMHVQVIEGTVKVASIDNSELSNKVLTAGQAIAVTQNGSMSEIFDHPNETMMDWQQGRLSYVNVPLSSVIYDVSRFVPLHIYIQDKSVGEMRFTGNIKLAHIEKWFADLPEIFPLTIQQYGDTKVMAKREL